MKKTVLLLSILFVFIASCSKEQKVVNKLEGTWKATSAKTEVSGLTIEVPFSTVTTSDFLFTFDACKVKDGVCTGSSVFEGVTDVFSYTIGGDGTTIDYLDSLGQTQSLEILELEKKTFEIQDNFGLDSTFTNIIVKFDKQ